MRSADLIRELEKAGWILRRVRGSHHVFVHPRPADCGRATSQTRTRRRPRRRNPQAGRASVMRYPIAIEPRTDNSEYGVVIPDLPGCFSAGETLEEAIAGAEEAGLAYLRPLWTPAIQFRPRRRWRRSGPTPNMRAGFCRPSRSIPRPSTTRSSASTSRCRAASCGGSTRRRAPRAKHGRAISPSSRSAGDLRNRHSAATQTAMPTNASSCLDDAGSAMRRGRGFDEGASTDAAIRASYARYRKPGPACLPARAESPELEPP